MIGQQRSVPPSVVRLSFCLIVACSDSVLQDSVCFFVRFRSEFLFFDYCRFVFRLIVVIPSTGFLVRFVFLKIRLVFSHTYCLPRCSCFNRECNVLRVRLRIRNRIGPSYWLIVVRIEPAQYVLHPSVWFFVATLIKDAAQRAVKYLIVFKESVGT